MHCGERGKHVESGWEGESGEGSKPLWWKSFEVDPWEGRLEAEKRARGGKLLVDGARFACGVSWVPIWLFARFGPIWVSVPRGTIQEELAGIRVSIRRCSTWNNALVVALLLAALPPF